MLKQTQIQNDRQVEFWSFRQVLQSPPEHNMRDVDPLLYWGNLPLSLLMEVVADTSLLIWQIMNFCSY